MILGIDPGVNGAIAWLDPGYVYACDLPTMTRGSSKKRKINAPELRKLLYGEGIEMAYIEQVAAMPGQGVSSMFNFGHACGVIEGVLAGLSIPYQFVTPQKWKKHYGIGKDKDRARALAQEFYPEAPLSLKKDHGKAEALLIARWGLAEGK